MNSYSDFKESLVNKKVLVWGLGISGGGVNVARFFAENGADVRVTDMKTEEQLQSSVDELKEFKNVSYKLGTQDKEDFLWADVIMKNPAIPPTNELLLAAYEAGKQVETELTLFFKYCKGYTIGITGTRGKSTTTALLTHILKQGKKRVWDGGNNRKSLIVLLDEINEDDLVVIEVSSFMCDSLNRVKVSPKLAIITNIYPDHLNWHPDMQHYIDSKGALVKYQSEDDIAVLNIDNPEVESNYLNSGNGRKVTTGKNADFKITENGVNDPTGFNYEINNQSLQGEHNLYNAAIAIAAATNLGIESEKMQSALSTYEGLEYRQQVIAVKSGVTYVNDSTSTMPQATLVCLERFLPLGPVHLVLGGVDKNLPLEPLLELLSKCTTIHLFEGSFYDKLLNDWSEINDGKVKGPFSSMKDAIDSARRTAKTGDYVILSPGAASFNLFKNEFDRAEQFDKLVGEI